MNIVLYFAISSPTLLEPIYVYIYIFWHNSENLDAFPKGLFERSTIHDLVRLIKPSLIDFASCSANGSLRRGKCRKIMASN